MGISIFSLLRTIATLGLMIGLMFGLARIARKRQSKLSGRGMGEGIDGIQVIARRSLGQHSSIALVKVRDRVLVVGQSANQISLLCEFDSENAITDSVSDTQDEEIKKKYPSPWKVAGDGSAGSGAWDAFLDNLREMTVRR